MQRYRYTVMIVTLILSMVGLSTFAQEPEPERDAETLRQVYYEEFNRVLREQYGTRALGRSPILDGIAQVLAESISCTEDPAEFDIPVMARAADYGLYEGDTAVRVTRYPLLPIVNMRSVEDMARFFTGAIFEENINQAGRFYREIGVGLQPCIAVETSGAVGSTPQYALFVILGAQPDVIPVVIENGEKELIAESLPLEVEISVHQENSRQLPGIFGRGVSLRLANEPITASTPSLAYQSAVTWQFDTCGENTLYYELTDAEGLSLEGSTSVELICPES